MHQLKCSNKKRPQLKLAAVTERNDL